MVTSPLGVMTIPKTNRLGSQLSLAFRQAIPYTDVERHGRPPLPLGCAPECARKVRERGDLGADAFWKAA